MTVSKTPSRDTIETEGSQLVPGKARWMNGSGKWVAGISAAIFVVWAGWVSVTLNSVDKRVAVIEGNRYDSRDGLRHAEADRQLHALVSSHVGETGHPVVVERVRSIEEDHLRAMERIEEKLNRHSILLREIEKSIRNGK